MRINSKVMFPRRSKRELGKKRIRSGLGVRDGDHAGVFNGISYTVVYGGFLIVANIYHF